MYDLSRNLGYQIAKQEALGINLVKLFL